MTKKARFLELLQRYREGKLTPEEKRLLDAWYNTYGAESLNELDPAELAEMEAELRGSLPVASPAKVRRLWPRIAAAAAVILIASAGIFYAVHQPAPDQQAIVLRQDVKPGGNKAILTLANGHKISLSDASNGAIAKQTGVTITKTASGQLIYSISNTSHNSGQLEYNMVETPKGGQYQVVLPDGSHVWLNAASSLKYPASFASLKDRKVELTGEAYFEVAKDKEHPFIVKSSKQEIKVLGTHFDVDSYADDPLSRTTLIEGSVKINDGAILRPGQQASMADDERIKVATVDVDKVIAWKNGRFMFQSESIESIMRKLARWYNIEVVYQDDVRDIPFTAFISRYDNISKILDKITYTQNIHFKIEGRRVTVMK